MLPSAAAAAVVLLLLVVRATKAFDDKPFNITAEGRIVNPWSNYTYNIETTGDLVTREYVLQEQRPRAFLMCPKGYVIGEMAYRLLYMHRKEEENGDNQPEDEGKEAPDAAAAEAAPVEGGARLRTPKDDPVFRVPFVERVEGVGALASYHGEGGDEARRICPSLSECLLFQACVFDFGNEFCLQDPSPGDRKNLDVNVTCVADARLADRLAGDDHERPRALFFQRRDSVLHITQLQRVRPRRESTFSYESQLEASAAEVDLAATKLERQERPEADVFGWHCPPDPLQAGYRGQCVANITAEESVERTWHLAARTASHHCRDVVAQTVCAIAYSTEGFCVPPYTIEPGQPADVGLGDLSYNEYSLPVRGPRPTGVPGTNPPNKELRPATVGFVIMVHKDVPAIVELLEAIYRPQHYYVFHVDRRSPEVRDALADVVGRRYAGTDNVVVLPADRSLVTSWGSFWIMRAQLEALEELCRLGHWDFAINMSGSDMAIRSVDDLALSLAPHRGHNFFGHHTWPRNRVDPSTNSTTQGASNNIVSCGGFTFVVSRLSPLPPIDVMNFRSASQWATLSRGLVEDVLDEARHPELWRRYFFRAQLTMFVSIV